MKKIVGLFSAAGDTKFFDEDDTDVLTRSSDGWRLRLTKMVPPPPQPRSN
ncbi:MAG TPA: hypothetical protein VJN92_02525 [Candidatus Acidoferrum sp.]|nr:hypothetical protein [Candidatus Acidoferrum sp.]